MTFDSRIIADRKIQEAIEEGQFDNLPGKGKPLDLDDDPTTPPHLRLANRILKNANVLPDWVQLEVEIEKARAECRAAFDRAVREYEGRKSQNSERQFAEWYSRTRSSYIRAMKSVNSDILKFNLVAPRTPYVQIPFRVDEETARFDSVNPPPTGADLDIKSAATEREHKFRSYAAERYRMTNRPDDSAT